LILVFLALAFLQVNAQKERKIIRGGNTLYGDKKYEKATTEYLKAKDIKANSFEAKFNLGDAMFKQKKYKDALGVFQNLTKTEKDRNRLGALYHNIGNSFLAMKKIDESIAAYEESLRNNPVSNETKYNLAYARMLKNQQQKQNKKNQNQKGQDKQNQDQDQKKKDQDKQNQDQKKKQDKDQNKQNSDQKNKDNQDKQNQDKQDKGNNKDKKEKGEQGAKAKISKEDAKRLLEALEADEKKVQEKVQKAKAKAQKSKVMKVQKKW